MKTREYAQIIKLQSVLHKIDNGINVFFNVSKYEKLGLIKARKKHGEDAVGNKICIGYSFHLTQKSKEYLKITINS